MTGEYYTVSERKLHKVYVYGTLRPGTTPTVKVPGYLYDLGWYPGILLKAPDSGSWVDCEIIEVDDAKLEQLDVYEGFFPDDPSSSLFVRRPYLDGYIYEYNRVVPMKKRIDQSDWLAYKSRDKTAPAMVDEEEAA